MIRYSIVLILLILSAPVFADDIVREKVPMRGEGISTAAALTLDVLPGGGHFYTGHYISGSCFAGMKIGGGFLLWFYYERMREAKKNFAGADRTRKSLGYSEDVPVNGPDGKTRTTAAYRRTYERSVQSVTFAAIGNLALYTASWLTVWYYCDQINNRAIPSFDLGVMPETDKKVSFVFAATFRF